MTRSVPIAQRHEAGDRYIPSVIAFLVLLVGVVMILDAMITAIAAISVFVDGFGEIATIAARQRQPFVGVVPFLLLLVRVGGWVLAAWLQYYIARKVIQGARWAWLVSAFLTAVGMLAIAFAESLLPMEVLLLLPPWWKLAVYGPGTFVIAVLVVALLFDWILGVGIGRAERRPRPTG